MTAIYAPVRTTRSAVSAARPTQPRLRMTARGRRVLLTLVAVPLVIGAAALALNGGSASASRDSSTLTYVSVDAGETLWQLAHEVAPQADPRDVIADIISLNGLHTEAVAAGQSLAIPPKYAH